MKFILITVAISIGIYIFIVTKNNPTKINGIEISRSILIYSNENNYNYVNLVKESLHKKNKSIIKLTLLYFDGGILYEHGNIILQIINRVGEEYFLTLIESSNLSLDKKYLAYYTLLSGIELFNPEKELSDIYPKITDYLLSNLKKNESLK